VFYSELFSDVLNDFAADESLLFSHVEAGLVLCDFTSKQCCAHRRGADPIFSFDKNKRVAEIEILLRRHLEIRIRSIEHLKIDRRSHEPAQAVALDNNKLIFFDSLLEGRQRRD